LVLEVIAGNHPADLDHKLDVCDDCYSAFSQWLRSPQPILALRQTSAT
jgi:hypothetical protein